MVTSDQGEKISIQEIFAYIWLAFPEAHPSSWSHWDCADSLPVVEAGAVKRESPGPLIPVPHPGDDGAVRTRHAPVEVGLELLPCLPGKLFKVLPRSVEAGATVF